MTPLLQAPILVTGADGFIGSALCNGLLARGASVRGASRYAIQYPPHPSLTPIAVGTFTDGTDWGDAIGPCATVIHAAGRAHVMHETARHALAEFRRINVECTLALAKQAMAMGVRRFIYISSAKVLGEGQTADYTDASPAAPQGPYAISKWEAEQGLRALTADSAMELVILRPPLVYGPGVKANFLSLLQLVERGWPLPLGNIPNRRSIIFIDNLVSAIIACLTHAEAADACFLLADAPPLSTTALVRAMAEALDRPARLFSVPPTWLQKAAHLLGKEEPMARLLSSFAIDASGMMQRLHWSPPVSTNAGLKKTAEWFKAEFRN